MWSVADMDCGRYSLSRPDLSIFWVDPRVGLDWAGLDWLGLGRYFQFLVGCVGSTVPKVLYFYGNYTKSTKN